MDKKNGGVLVVGSGISGIRAAIDLADIGHQVTLIDRDLRFGGILAQLDRQFPSNRCGMCKMLPMIQRDAASQYCLRKGLDHERIQILLATELVSVDGEAGNFQVALRRHPQWVDPARCIGCGLCQDVCPVEITDDFNAGLGRLKAIHRPVPHVAALPFTIDVAACNRCGECVKVCPTEAIHLMGQERQNFRILIVDDELIVRESLADLLSEEGFFTETADSGNTALDLLSAQEFHLMLTDIKMPGMDGVELLTKAKQIQPQLHVIMMTAYATVETAVEAMKIGALDYLIKPFDPDRLIPMVVQVHEDVEKARAMKLDVGAIVLCGGVGYFQPEQAKNTLGYGIFPNVVTSLEFERMLSRSGPFQGRLIRPLDARPVTRISWIQCVGSRDLQTDADFCSGICCMFAIKQAMLARETGSHDLDLSIFYMDMRTFGKSFEQYRHQAETQMGIRFQRGRVHTITQDSATGDLRIRWMAMDGTIHEEARDVIVLSTGQRPAPGTQTVKEILNLDLNPWGFVETDPFFPTHTTRPGVFIGGAFSGLKDIRDSVIQASAAALSASMQIHASGSMPEPDNEEPLVSKRDVSRELPRMLVGICTCGGALATDVETGAFSEALKKDPTVDQVIFSDKWCTQQGWAAFCETLAHTSCNRILLCACMHCAYHPRIKTLSEITRLEPSLMDVVDIRSHMTTSKDRSSEEVTSTLMGIIRSALARLAQANPAPPETVSMEPRALVVGGGIAGMTAALAIADHGYTVDLVEIGHQLGGNLLWLKQTIDGHTTTELLNQTTQQVLAHPRIQVHTESRVVSSFGQIGNMFTSLEHSDGHVTAIHHGVVILATGGKEAATDAYGHGTETPVMTQMELEMGIDDGTVDVSAMTAMVMIQCVGSRQGSRMYCSRICCVSSLKLALSMKERHPDLGIYILYRDIMTYGFFEKWYTEARKAGVIFIPYDEATPPDVTVQGDVAQVTVMDPIIRKTIQITADRVVLATGIVPVLPPDLAMAFGVETDGNGFFREAESKWRPVEALKQGVFACGLAQSPANISESIASAQSAAMQALKVLSHKQMPVSRNTARVRHSLCSQCLRCIDACPYGARVLDGDPPAIQVNPTMCQGCGACAVACPNGAAIVSGFEKAGMLNVIQEMIS